MYWRVVRQIDTTRDRLCRADLRNDENPGPVTVAKLARSRNLTTPRSVLPI